MKFKIFMILACSFAGTIDASSLDEEMTLKQFINKILELELEDDNYCKTIDVLYKVINAALYPIENQLGRGRIGSRGPEEFGDFSENGLISKKFYELIETSDSLFKILKKPCYQSRM